MRIAMQLQHVYQPEGKSMQTKCLSLLMTCQNPCVMDCAKICHVTAVVPRLSESAQKILLLQLISK